MADKATFSVCFSGHRPEQLPVGTAMQMLRRRLLDEIDSAVRDGADTFYTGMAQGVDILAAESVLSCRQRRRLPIRLIAVRPYAGHGKELRRAALYRYNSILEGADEVVVLRDAYARSCYTERNAYMIAHSRRLIAVVGNMQSGTGQTIRMAEKAGLELRILKIAPVLL